MKSVVRNASCTLRVCARICLSRSACVCVSLCVYLFPAAPVSLFFSSFFYFLAALIEVDVIVAASCRVERRVTLFPGCDPVRTYVWLKSFARSALVRRLHAHADRIASKGVRARLRRLRPRSSVKNIRCGLYVATAAADFLNELGPVRMATLSA